MNGNQNNNTNNGFGTESQTNQYNSINNNPVNDFINPSVNNSSNNYMNSQFTNNNFSGNNQVYTNNNVTSSYNGNSYTQENPKKSLNIKNILMVLIGLALIVGVGVIIFKLFFSDTAKEKEILNQVFDPNKPIIIKKDGKYGYITSEGKTMIEPQYKNVDEFHGKYALVNIENPDKESYNDNLYQIIDKKGNVKLSTDSFSIPRYYPEYNIWVIDEVLYDSNLKKVLDEGITVDYIEDGYLEYVNKNKNESGIIDYKGKKYFSWAETSISVSISSSYDEIDELYAIVRSYGEKEKEIVVSLKNGNVLYNLNDPENYQLSYEYNGIFYLFNTNDYKHETWLYFADNKLVYEVTDADIEDIEVYDYEKQILEIDYGYDYEELGKEQRYYYYDAKGKKMLNEKQSGSSTNNDLDIDLDLMELVYGYKEFSSSGKYGIMKKDKIVIPCEYDNIEFLNEPLFKYIKNKKNKELVLLKKDDKTILMNLKNKKEIATFNSDYVSDDSESTFLEMTVYKDNDYEKKETTVYNLLTNKYMTFDANAEVYVYSNYITVEKDNQIIYYNTKFKQIYTENA